MKRTFHDPKIFYNNIILVLTVSLELRNSNPQLQTLSQKEPSLETKSQKPHHDNKPL